MPRLARRAAVLTIVGALAVGCGGGGEPGDPDATGGPLSERGYWPTDDWRTADPAEHGFDADEIAEIERLVDEHYASVRSILVVRDGYLVYEHYWQGLDADDGHDAGFATKAVVGALVGIAIADGAIDDLDQPLSELLGDLLPAA